MYCLLHKILRIKKKKKIKPEGRGKNKIKFEPKFYYFLKSRLVLIIYTWLSFRTFGNTNYIFDFPKRLALRLLQTTTLSVQTPCA